MPIESTKFSIELLMEPHPRLYLGLAFVAGVGLTLALKDAYPTLQRRFEAAYRDRPTAKSGNQQSKVKLAEHGSRQSHDRDDLEEDVREGIEGCIGNTPLIRIKSLSDATGCEVLGKAEV